MQAIARTAERLNGPRENSLSPLNLVAHEPEVMPCDPGRILPKDEVAAKVLAKRTLTNPQNARPA